MIAPFASDEADEALGGLLVSAPFVAITALPLYFESGQSFRRAALALGILWLAAGLVS